MKPKGNSECVQVMVRCRPMNSKEKNNGSKACVVIDKSVNSVIVTAPDDKGEAGRQFTYDAVYDWDSK